MKYRLVILLCVCAVNVTAQIGTRFWFAVPYLSNAHDNSLTGDYGKLCLSTYDVAATVTITQVAITNTADPHYFAPIVLQIASGSSVDVSIKGSGINRSEYAKKVPYGLLIESTADISVYFAQTNANSEIYTLKGDNALGTQFTVGMQNSLSNWHNGYSTIEILATENNTDLTIVTPVPTRNDPTGTTLQVSLNRGEVYTVAARGMSAADHLTGTTITATRPIVVNSTDDSAAASGQDLIGDQLVADDLTGTEYIAIRGSGEVERLYILILQDGTTYSVNGASVNGIYQKGDIITFDLHETTTYLELTKQAVVFQVTGVGGELGGTQLPRLGCTGSHRMTYTTRFTQNPTVNIITRSDYIGSFTVNGSATSLTASDFTLVPHTTDWYYCTKTLSPNTKGYLRIENSAGVFQGSVLDYGGGGTCTYGYFSDYNTERLSVVNGKDYYMEGEPLDITLEDSQLYDDIQWTLADGSTYQSISLTVAAQMGFQGYAFVSATSKDGCSIADEQKPIVINVLRSELHDTTICAEGELGLHYGEKTLSEVKHRGADLINEDNIIITCSSTATEIWNYAVEVTDQWLYELAFDVSIANQNRRPIVEVDIDNLPIDTLQTQLITTPYHYSAQWQSRKTGRIDISLQTLLGTTGNSILNISNLSFSPLFAIEDTFRINTSALQKPLIAADKMQLSAAETATLTVTNAEAVEYVWYKDGKETNTGISLTGQSGEYYVVASTEDGCTAQSDPLRITSLQAADTTATEPQIEPYALSVEIADRQITLCDGDTLLPIIYHISEGTPHTVTIGDNVYPLTDEELLIPYSASAGRHTLSVVFTDTVHHLSTAESLITVDVLYNPLYVFTQKWGNTLAAYNRLYNGYELQLTDYQWLEDGTEITGATASYLYFPDGLPTNHQYQLRSHATNDAGETIEILTCPYTPISQTTETVERETYNVYGQKIPHPTQRGLYIIRENNNKTSKFIIL